MSTFYTGKGGAVPLPRLILAFRALQLLFAILTLAMTAYALSIAGGGPIRPPLIAAIIISLLTLLPILLLTTPLHLMQRKVYDPRIALLSDGFATLFWLSSFAALASYQDIFSGYGRAESVVDLVLDECRKCRSAWRAGVAATVFAAFEFLLFLFTTLAFVYYYHCHLVGETAPGLTSHHNQTHAHKAHKDSAADSAFAGSAVGVVTGPTTNSNTQTHESHQMGTLPQTQSNSPTNNNNNNNFNNYQRYASPTLSVHANGNDMGHGNGNGVHVNNDIPYPTNGPRADPPYPKSPTGGNREGGYGGYQYGMNTGYGVERKGSAGYVP